VSSVTLAPFRQYYRLGTYYLSDSTVAPSTLAEGNNVIVVTGATGNAGRPLVQRLVEAGEQVTAVSRRLTAADVPSGVERRQADLTRPKQLPLAFDGADALFLMDTGIGAHLINSRDILDAAKSGGARRVVLLSSLGVATRPDSPSHGGLMRSVEDAVLRSEMDWTILRPGAFASNAYAWAESVRSQRIVAAPFGGVGVPVIDPADIAGVAAAALRQAGHTGRFYELTGPPSSRPGSKPRRSAMRSVSRSGSSSRLATRRANRCSGSCLSPWPKRR
jgi:uncharacterized protein YbjT (DUF2867 family)